MAQGNYGTSNNPLGSVHGEQWILTPLTSDPPSSEREEGSKWFRSDLDSGDKIGTLRLQNDDAGTDIDDIPVFAEGDAVDGVVKARPIQTASGEGFVPYVQEGGAFDQLRFQHNGTWYGAHDSLNAIPNSGAAQAWYDFREASGTSAVVDKSANGNDLSGTYTGPTGNINGNQAGRFNGSSDLLSTSFSAVTKPTTLFAVVQLRSTSSEFFQYAFDGGTDSVNEQAFVSNNGGDSQNADTNWAIAGLLAIEDGAADTNPHILTAFFNGANSHLRLDGTQVASGDTGSLDVSGITLGARSDGSNHGPFDIGEYIMYPEDRTGEQAEHEQYLSDGWGVAI